MKTFTAVIHSEDNFYVADCPEVGTVSQGKTIDEAIENLKEATEAYIEETKCTNNNGRTFITTFEIAANA